MTFLVCLFFVASYTILAIILTFFENYVVGDFVNDFVLASFCLRNCFVHWHFSAKTNLEDCVGGDFENDLDNDPGEPAVP